MLLPVNPFALLLALILIFISYCKYRFQYWKKRNVPFLEPSVPWGTSGFPFWQKEPSNIRIKRRYDTMRENGWKHGGLYTMLTPNYMVLDLDYVKNILTKDFQHFTDRGVFFDEKSDPISGNLFFLGGTKWRNLRTKLSPTFTSGKMKMMFQTLLDCNHGLLNAVGTKNGAPIDIKEVLGCYTTEIIGSCAFGLECDTFKDETSPFRVYGRKVFEPSSFLGIVKFLVMTAAPGLAKFLRFSVFPKESTDFFLKIVKDTVEYRERNQILRKDFMQLLIDLKNENLLDENGQKVEGTSLTIEEIAAQSFVFFIAGFETSSTTMAFALYELSKHPDVQEKLRDEITTVLQRHNNEITYDAIQEMKYMDLVINETLRKYPPLPVLSRKCVKDYKIPGEDVVIEKGTRVLISVLGIHYDEQYYPEPEKFDPERFNDVNKSLRHGYAHIPFGEGPRLCIGMRFGLMQTKVGLTSLLQNFQFTVDTKTKQPIKMKKSFILAVEGELWLRADKIEEKPRT